MKQMIRDLARARFDLREQKAELALAMVAFENQYGVLVGEIKNSAQMTQDLETKLREEILAHPEEAREAKGVGIKKVTVIRYDEKKALEWAVDEGHYNLLTLKKRPFETVAKALAPDFAAILIETQATISKDLSSYLVEG